MDPFRRAFFREVAFYRDYHQHPWNWRIHAVSVPLEVMTFLVPLACVNPRLPVAVSIAIALYALVLDPPRTIVPAAVTGLLGLAAERLSAVSGRTQMALLVAAFLHATSWVLQVAIGHWLIEKNRPAMQDKLTLNSIVLSPVLALYI